MLFLFVIFCVLMNKPKPVKADRCNWCVDKGWSCSNGPSQRNSQSSWKDWYRCWDGWRRGEYGKIDHNHAFARKELQWARTSFLAPQTMVHARTLYDQKTGKFTVQKYLDDVEERFGGIDSILLWQGYPNIGTDDRNLFRMAYDACGMGAATLENRKKNCRKLVKEFQDRGVPVLWAIQPWDHGTRDSVRDDHHKSHDHAWLDLLKSTGADGINGDTWGHFPRRMIDVIWNGYKPVALEPESTGLGWGSGHRDDDLSFHTGGWKYVDGVSWGHPAPVFTFEGCRTIDKFQQPRVQSYKAVTQGKWTGRGNQRWAGRCRIGLMLEWYFQGLGYATWELIWGITNKISPRDAEVLKRYGAILRFFRDIVTNPYPSRELHKWRWRPYVPIFINPGSEGTSSRSSANSGSGSSRGGPDGRYKKAGSYYYQRDRGNCRGGHEKWASGNAWRCSDNTRLGSCLQKCSDTSGCGAVDIEGANCCMFRGQGWHAQQLSGNRRHCWVQLTSSSDISAAKAQLEGGGENHAIQPKLPLIKKKVKKSLGQGAPAAFAGEFSTEKHRVWLLINKEDENAHMPSIPELLIVNLDCRGLAGYGVGKPTLVDAYGGRILDLNVDYEYDANSGTARVFRLPLERMGLGALLLYWGEENAPDGDYTYGIVKNRVSLGKFLEKMRSLTEARPLWSFTEHSWKPTQQYMLNGVNRRTCPRPASSSGEAQEPQLAAPKGMLFVRGSEPMHNWFLFESNSQIMEGVTFVNQDTWKWESATNDRALRRGFGEQHPWESAPMIHHKARLYMKPFFMHEFLVTNEMYLGFLKESDLLVDRLNSDHSFLRHWTRKSSSKSAAGTRITRTFPRGAERQPVRWVDPFEAQQFCHFYNLRLPHEWEWQWAARDINEGSIARPKQRKYPRAEHESNFPTVDGMNDAAPTTGIRNLWYFMRQYTDIYADEYMARAVLKGGSFYAPYHAHGKGGCWWCENQPQKKEHYDSYLVGPRGLTRSAMVSFRCVADFVPGLVAPNKEKSSQKNLRESSTKAYYDTALPRATANNSTGDPNIKVDPNCKLYGCDVQNGGTRQACLACKDPSFHVDDETGICTRPSSSRSKTKKRLAKTAKAKRTTVSRRTTRSSSSGAAAAAAVPQEVCSDRHENCSLWAELGYCADDKYVDKLRELCCKSCAPLILADIAKEVPLP